MNKKVAFGVFGVIGILFLVFIISIVSTLSARGTAVELEEKVEAQYTSNKSNYDNMWKSFQEMAQIPAMQADDFKKVYDQMISGRYEKNENLLFQMVQEQNPQLSQDVYRDLQNHIAAGRKEFDNNQKKIADIIREYNTYIRKHFIMNSIFRFKKLKSEDYIVTSAKTQKAFESGQDDVIDLKGNK